MMSGAYPQVEPFTAMFRSFTPQLVAFFKARGGEARHALCRHLRRRAAEIETVDLADVPERLAASNRFTTFLEAPEREALTLRFIGNLEYHEIAAVQTIPVGTAQWRVFNARKKLRPRLRRIDPLVATRAS